MKRRRKLNDMITYKIEEIEAAVKSQFSDYEYVSVWAKEIKFSPRNYETEGIEISVITEEKEGVAKIQTNMLPVYMNNPEKFRRCFLF